MRYEIVKGAIIGDIVGSRFEFDNTNRTDFELFTDECYYTDDTVLTVATIVALRGRRRNFSALYSSAVREYRRFGNKYAEGEYGGRFALWLKSENPMPYNSLGNGACMRVSPCVYAGDLSDQLAAAEAVTSVTHNHPNALMWVERYIYMINAAKSGKAAFEEYVTSKDWCPDKTLKWYRENNKFDETCDGTMPVVIAAVLASDSYEDCIRKAISTGGDSDTIACIAGALAAAMFGVPVELWNEAITYLPEKFINELELIL